MADAWGGPRFREVFAPIRSAFAITPNDSTEFTDVTRALFTGAGGDIAVLYADDSATVTMEDCPAGVWLPVQVKKVLSTGTTVASGILGGI